MSRATIRWIKDLSLRVAALEARVGTHSPAPITNSMSLQAFLSSPVGSSGIGLSTRAANCLLREGTSGGVPFGPIRHVWQLCELSERDLIGRPALGRKTLQEIKETLRKQGLQLGMKFPTL